jgi:uncharacterized membrane protein
MAIQRRALFALSIAFVASLAAYPDLPPDIPPRAGRDGAFIGAPFVAFFLPIAAAAVWWILTSLTPSGRTAACQARRAGAATVLFLSAFHITMLAGFIGGHAWPGRLLGAFVGLFLVITGNDLPRLKPNLAWGIRTRHTLGSEEVWRRVHRVDGYLRVVIGLAVCAAALAGYPEVTALIVLAGCVEAGLAVLAGRVGVIPELSFVASRRGGDPGSDCV